MFVLKGEEKRTRRETLGQIQKMRMSSMQMISKLDMPLPHSLPGNVQAGSAGPPCWPANPDSAFPVSVATPERMCKNQTQHHL